MLDEIFNEKVIDNSISDDEEVSKEKKQIKKEDNVIHREVESSMKSRCADILNKFCTLYDKDKCIQPLNINHINKKKRIEEMKNSTGPMWFNMTAPEMTPELKEDLKAMQVKQYTDPTQFFKKNDKKKLAKFFQIGTIQDNILEGKKNRLKKSEVRNRIAEEILDRDISKSYTLKKFDEIQKQRRKIGLKKSQLNKYKLRTKGKTRGVVAK